MAAELAGDRDSWPILVTSTHFSPRALFASEYTKARISRLKSPKFYSALRPTIGPPNCFLSVVLELEVSALIVQATLKFG